MFVGGREGSRKLQADPKIWMGIQMFNNNWRKIRKLEDLHFQMLKVKL